jgi:hypothetical protein
MDEIAKPSSTWMRYIGVKKHVGYALVSTIGQIGYLLVVDPPIIFTQPGW